MSVGEVKEETFIKLVEALVQVCPSVWSQCMGLWQKVRSRNNGNNNGNNVSGSE